MIEHRKKRSTGATHKGFIHLKTVDHHAVAAHILKVNWHGRDAKSIRLQS